MVMKADIEAEKAGVRRKFVEVCDILDDLAEERKVEVSKSTSTGIISLDAALGGKLTSGAVEVFGGPSSGKSTLLYEIIATAQSSGFTAALCPSEHLDITYLRKFGIDLDNLILVTGNCGESTLEGAMDFLDAHQDVRSLLAFDSATGLRPEKDDPGEWLVLWDTFLETALEAPLHPSTCMVMVNQVRMQRSIEPNRFFVDGAVTSTAKKIVSKFSTRLELSRGADREGNHTMRINVVANNTARPSRMLEVPLIPGEGVDTMRDLLQFGVAMGVVEQAGAWYTVGGKYKLGSGVKEAVKQLEENDEVSGFLLDQVMVRA